MMLYTNLSPALKGALLLWSFLLFCFSVVVFVRHVQVGTGKFRITAAFACAFFCLLWEMKLSSETTAFPLLLVLLLMLLVTAAQTADLLLLEKRRHAVISAESVRESMNLLPSGVCFYQTGGLPVLVNRKMAEICRALTGEALLDAVGFWDFLQAGKAEGAVREGSTPIVCLPDGSAFSFSQYENTFNGKPIFELIAADVSEEYRLTGDLEEKRKHAEYINKRLKALNASVRYLIMDRETLELKIRIHDSLGETILVLNSNTKTHAVHTDKNNHYNNE